MYTCPTCGAGLVFDPKSQKLQCLSCRNQYDPENIEKMHLDQAKETSKQLEEDIQGEYEAISYKCSHCGAELITTDETITTFCSFCRMGTMLDRKKIKKRKPDYIIPFKITKEQCREIYINTISKSFFAPKTMIDTQEVEKIRGIYMPYWIYSYEKHEDDETKGEKYSHSSGDYDYYDDYLLTTNIDAEISGITHDATSNFSDRLSESIAPFSTNDKKEFLASYLSGFYADNEDVDEKIYINDGKKIAETEISSRLSKEKEYRNYGASPNIKMHEKKAKLALFPIYFLATKNNKGDRISYAVINGQTGKIAADIPIDIKKFIGFSAILSVVIFILLTLTLTISIPVILGCSLIFNLVSMSILISQNRKINIRENFLDDKGANKPKKDNINNDKKYKDLSFIKPLIGLILTVLLMFLKPASDMYYYIVALISIGMSIFSFHNIINHYNLLTTRKLPQLEKRGGDENA